MRKILFLAISIPLIFLSGYLIFLSGYTVNIPTKESSIDCDIKGNINTQGDKVYHLKECLKYNTININPNKGEKWFCSAEEAEKDGWVKSKNCP